MMHFTEKCLLSPPNIPESDLQTAQKNLSTRTTSESKITSNNAINANSNAIMKQNASTCNDNPATTITTGSLATIATPARESDSKTNELKENHVIISQHLPHRISPEAEKLMSQYF